jgi:hypothetical protein
MPFEVLVTFDLPDSYPIQTRMDPETDALAGKLLLIFLAGGVGPRRSNHRHWVATSPPTKQQP